ncbi:hypothetical protein ACGFX4_39015 [Kitasatospora sp. NPDC048365]|uniref:hypothetical protein n=1 Tax=Kitasatospora sp. NPDC048365 TaxID=3364050 RepID=UPI003717BACC
MQVHRSAHARDFTVLPNAALQDRRLSFTARGLLADLLSRPDRWREDARQMADTSTQSRAAVRKALRELMEAGYYRVEKVRMPDGTIRSEAHVYDTPQAAGSEATRWPVETRSTKAKPDTPRPAPGEADSGAAGVPEVKNPAKVPSLPGGARDERVTVDADGRVREAAVELHRVLAAEPRLRLGAVEALQLAPLVARWLGAGCGRAELAAALLPGLPRTIHSPAAVLRDRLTRKMPVTVAGDQPVDRLGECPKCACPSRGSRLCGTCRGGPVTFPGPGIGGGAAFTASGAARARAAMREAREVVTVHVG